MSKCRSTSFYLAPGLLRYFSDCTLAALLPDGSLRQILHRSDVASLEKSFPSWSGTVLCGPAGGIESLRLAILDRPASVERWTMSSRTVEGRRPRGQLYPLHVLSRRGLQAAGGAPQLLSAVFPGANRPLRRAAESLLQGSGSNSAYRLSLAASARSVLTDDTVANLLRSRNLLDHLNYRPLDPSRVSLFLSKLRALHPNQIESLARSMLTGLATEQRPGIDWLLSNLPPGSVDLADLESLLDVYPKAFDSWRFGVEYATRSTLTPEAALHLIRRDLAAGDLYSTAHAAVPLPDDVFDQALSLAIQSDDLPTILNSFADLKNLTPEQTSKLLSSYLDKIHPVHVDDLEVRLLYGLAPAMAIEFNAGSGSRVLEEFLRIHRELGLAGSRTSRHYRGIQSTSTSVWQMLTKLDPGVVLSDSTALELGSLILATSEKTYVSSTGRISVRHETRTAPRRFLEMGMRIEEHGYYRDYAPVSNEGVLDLICSPNVSASAAEQLIDKLLANQKQDSDSARLRSMVLSVYANNPNVSAARLVELSHSADSMRLAALLSNPTTPASCLDDLASQVRGLLERAPDRIDDYTSAGADPTWDDLAVQHLVSRPDLSLETQRMLITALVRGAPTHPAVEGFFANPHLDPSIYDLILNDVSRTSRFPDSALRALFSNKSLSAAQAERLVRALPVSYLTADLDDSDNVVSSRARPGEYPDLVTAVVSNPVLPRSLRESVAAEAREVLEQRYGRSGLESDGHVAAYYSVVLGGSLTSPLERRLDAAETVLDRDRLLEEQPPELETHPDVSVDGAILSTEPARTRQKVWPSSVKTLDDLPNYDALPFVGIENFSGTVNGLTYVPSTSHGAVPLDENLPDLDPDTVLTVRNLDSGYALRRNADYMENCTGGYARSIASGSTRIVGVYNSKNECVYNISFARGRDYGDYDYYDYYDEEPDLAYGEDPNEYQGPWRVAEVNSRFNNGSTRESTAISESILSLLNASVPNTQNKPLLELGDPTPAEDLEEQIDRELYRSRG